MNQVNQIIVPTYHIMAKLNFKFDQKLKDIDIVINYD